MKREPCPATLRSFGKGDKMNNGKGDKMNNVSVCGKQGKAWRRNGVASALLLASSAFAQDVQTIDQQRQAIEQLKTAVGEQNQQLEVLKREIARQEERLSETRRALGASALATTRGTGPVQVAQAQEPTPVGQAPEKSRVPEVAPIFEQPGVLTPKGKFVLEPSLQYSYSSSNRVALVGFTIIPALLIGLIDVREVKRDTFTAAVTGRFGLTDRLELEARLPYVYRSDSTISRQVLTGTSTDSVFDASGSGIGDVELTARYQFNDGGADKPYFIGSLRYKSRTGKDPFQVVTDLTLPGGTGTGLQREPPRGSGFNAIQPGITWLYPSDPAVFFGSFSYLHNLKRNVTQQINGDQQQDLGSVEPGDIIGFNFGMGLALNEKSSFSIGYDHNSVGKTKQNGQVAPASVRTQLATLLLGYSYRVSDKTTLNVSVGAGLTRDTPDVTLNFRLPMSF